MKQNLSKLMESELEKAEVILAAKAIAQDIQDMTEKVAKSRVDDLMPLVDRMKELFSQSEAESFQQSVDGVLEQLQDQLTSAKDTVENQANILSGEGEPESEMEPGMSDMEDMDMEPDMDMDMEEPEGEDDFDEFDGDDLFGGSEPAAGEEEPLGRAKKESFQNRKRSIAEQKRILARQIKLAERKIQRLKAKT